jgi:hypothetical protein
MESRYISKLLNYVANILHMVAMTVLVKVHKY